MNSLKTKPHDDLVILGAYGSPGDRYAVYSPHGGAVTMECGAG